MNQNNEYDAKKQESPKLNFPLQSENQNDQEVWDLNYEFILPSRKSSQYIEEVSLNNGFRNEYLVTE